MTNEDVLALYESVADITTQMLAAARTGDWEQLAALESRCSRQVEILKAEEPVAPLPPVQRERKVKIIKKILDDDRQIRDITEPWLAHLSAMISSAGTERKLAKAYGAGQN
ncbi:MAG TPA: flagellar protein FliT [Noviherbaspirillum sp.]|nr:flagellar protein FliT [Noviherbaspirillum sp.]